MEPPSPRAPSAAPLPPLAQQRQECSINRWIRNSENASVADGGQEQLFHREAGFLENGAASGPPHGYAASEASSLHSRQGHTVNKALQNLQKANYDWSPGAKGRNANEIRG